MPTNPSLQSAESAASFSIASHVYPRPGNGEAMGSQSQISATISEATKERLDRFVESRGLKKNFVVEQALLYFIEARSELPDEALVPARLLLEDKAFDRIAKLVTSPQAPTEALRELMRAEGD